MELNAFSSGDFIQWIEGKLKENGIRKVVPDDAALADAFRLAVEEKAVRAELPALQERARRQAAAAAVPEGLRRQMTSLMNTNPAMPWDQAVRQVVDQTART